MTRYIVRRVIISVPVLFGITVLTFLFINLAPGDPVDMMIDPAVGQQMTREEREAQRAQLGLNQPLPIRYAIWLTELAQGNFGYSYADRRPVLLHIRDRLGPTLELTGTALFFALLLAIPLGVLSAL